MLSPTGTSKMWDSAADGYARGEGIAAVVMKPLSAALRDGDHIDCVIRGTAGKFLFSPIITFLSFSVMHLLSIFLIAALNTARSPQ